MGQFDDIAGQAASGPQEAAAKRARDRARAEADSKRDIAAIADEWRTLGRDLASALKTAGVTPRVSEYISTTLILNRPKKRLWNLGFGVLDARGRWRYNAYAGTGGGPNWWHAKPSDYINNGGAWTAEQGRLLLNGNPAAAEIAAFLPRFIQEELGRS